MSERNYYVICDDNCRFEGMTKEQIINAIYEATGVIPEEFDEAIITMIKEQNQNNNMEFWKGTQAEYNALESKDSETFYVIVPDSTSPALVNTLTTENLNFLTEAPTEENNIGLKVVVLENEPETKYDGYIYFIKKAR